MPWKKSDSYTRKKNNSIFLQNNQLLLPFFERDPTQEVAGSYKSKETNISSGTVLSDAALWSLLTHSASLRSSLDKDMICFEAKLSTVLLGRVCWVVAWQQSEETFNLFNTKCYLPAWTRRLSTAIHRVMNHQSRIHNSPSEVISGLLHCSNVIKHPLITFPEKWYTLCLFFGSARAKVAVQSKLCHCCTSM